MANSIKPTTETTTGGAKKYLDYAGLNALWDNICDKFSPQWKTVSWEFIRDNNPTHNADNVVLPFQNLSNPPTEQGVANHSQLTNTWYTINAATPETAGVMSAADKTKLDGLESTAEQAVTVKTIMVGNSLDEDDAFPASALTINNTTDKAVAFGLSYDADSDLLSIMDLNYKPDPTNKPNDIVPRALSSVHILGDVLQNAFIDADNTYVTDIGKDGEEGLFIKITFITKTQDGDEGTTPVFINVADLIDIYTEGEGISIGDSDYIADGDPTRTQISIKAPTTTTKGGIISKKVYTGTAGNVAPTVQTPSTQALRYFGIETDSNGNAFVNAPSADVAVETATASDTVDNTSGSDTFTAVTGIQFELDKSTDKYIITPTTTTYTVAKETELSKTPTNAVATAGKIELNGAEEKSFKVISDVNVNDHTITLTEKTFTIKESELSFTEDDEILGTDAGGELVLEPGTTITVDMLSDLTIDAHHTLGKHKYTSITVKDPASIEIDYIEGLQWAIPITKQYLPNE